MEIVESSNSSSPGQGQWGEERRGEQEKKREERKRKDGSSRARPKGKEQRAEQRARRRPRKKEANERRGEEVPSVARRCRACGRRLRRSKEGRWRGVRFLKSRENRIPWSHGGGPFIVSLLLFVCHSHWHHSVGCRLEQGNTASSSPPVLPTQLCPVFSAQSKSSPIHVFRPPFPSRADAD